MMSDQPAEEQAIAGTYSYIPSPSDAYKPIHPMTIFQVLQAEASPPVEDNLDKSLVIEERGYATVNVALVAHVTSVEMQTTRAVYTLEDGTGRIHAEKDLNSVHFHRGSTVEAEREEIAQNEALEHTYVEVTGIPHKGNLNWGPRIKIRSILPIHSYNQEHPLADKSSSIDTSFHWQSDGSMEIDMPVDLDGGQAYQEDTNAQHHIIHTNSASHPILSNIFLPQRQQPYAALQPLEMAIMKHMHHNKHCQVLITDMGQVIQASYGCTETQFVLAIQALLSEAYITSPLDDGYVILTPRR